MWSKWYVPGMVSLLLLPTMCIWHFRNYIASLQQHCLSITFSILPDDPENAYSFASEEDLPKRIWHDISIPIKTEHPDSALLELRDMIVRFDEPNDTLNGIHIALGPEASWRTFISAMDMCLVDPTAHYKIVNADIWRFRNSHSDSIRTDAEFKQNMILDFCGTCNQRETKKFDFLKDVIKPLLQDMKNFWPSSILLMLLAYLSLRRSWS